MQLVITNSYGTPNLGDEAILHAMCKFYLMRGHSITILSNTGKEPSRPPPTGTSYAKAGPLNLLQTFRTIRGADLLLIGGGGIIQSSTSLGNLLFHLSRTWLAFLAKTPYIFIGVGVGPIPHKIGKVLAKWSFNRARFISVRDQASADYLRSVGVGKAFHEYPDLAFALPIQDAHPPRPDDLLRIGISLRPEVGSARKRSDINDALMLGMELLKGIALTCEALDRKIQVFFLSFNDEQDLKIGTSLAELRPETPDITICHANISPADYVKVISTMHCTIAMRLHCIILSALASTPSIGIPYDTKVSTTLEMLGQGDLLLKKSTSGEEVKNMLLSTISELEHRRRTIQNNVKILREKAKISMQVATCD